MGPGPTDSDQRQDRQRQDRQRQDRFSALYRSTRPQVVAYALRRAASPEDAADVVAETFTVAWRRLDDVPDGDAALLWCYATARRVLANLHRSTRRRGRLVDRIGAQLATAAPHVPDGAGPSAVAARQALGRLSDDDRELLMLSGWEGLTPSELACVLDCSATAARIRLHRARGRLAVAMADAGLAAPAKRPAAAAKQPADPGHSLDRQPTHEPVSEAP